MHRVLVVEDVDSLREVLESVLAHEGFEVTAVATAEAAADALKQTGFSLILSDFKLPQRNGLDLLRETREITKTTPFILMTAYGSIDIAVEAMKLGANDFITKPFEPTRLCAIVREVIQHRQIIDRNNGTRTRRERSFLSKNAEVERMLAQARKVAKVDTSVLLLGESGTGKELMARFIHEHSSRSEEAFIAVNCAAMPADLLESEFFGHESGAFTGATQSRVGVFELAAEGTLFLDEIGDMPPALQVKILRALQEREIKRVGGSKSIKINPRIIAATNRPIDEALNSGTIREDLYFRIAVVSLNLPPLRERPEDILLLAEHYKDYFAGEMGKSQLKFSDEVRSFLIHHRWPGNARELENVIERAVILAEDQISIEHLGVTPQVDVASLEDAQLSLHEIAQRAMRSAEEQLIRRVLTDTRGNKAKASRVLGVSYKTLLNKVKEYGLEQPEEAAPDVAVVEERI